jgi:hypothetical protein
MGSVEDDDGAEGRDDAEDWMDEDGDGDADESAPKKRVKTNSGGVINRREPKSDRQMAGLRDQEVSHLLMAFWELLQMIYCHVSNTTKLSSCGILVNVQGICMPRQASLIVLSE